jgi:serine phosphatase RsbU (regulator of sigma subunit)
VTLIPVNVLLLYTDGLLERRDGSRMLGEAGVLRLAEACRGHSAVSVANTVLQGAIEFTPAPLRDDIALLAVRALPPTPNST